MEIVFQLVDAFAQLVPIIGRTGFELIEILNGFQFADNSCPFLFLPLAGLGFKVTAQFLQQPLRLFLNLLLGSDPVPAEIVVAADKTAFPKVGIQLDAHGTAKFADFLNRLSSDRFQDDLEIFSSIPQGDEFIHQRI